MRDILVGCCAAADAAAAYQQMLGGQTEKTNTAGPGVRLDPVIAAARFRMEARKEKLTNQATTQNVISVVGAEKP
jgi:hypothetical protein